MSCVIGLKHERKVYIGSDGIATTEDGDTRPIVCKKVFTNGPYLIGFCGSVRTGQLLYPYNFTPPNKISAFPNSIRDHFQENGVLLSGDVDNVDRHTSNFLIGAEGKLYEILIDFQMSEVIEFSSIGSGSPYAFGALEILRNAKGMSPESKILKTLIVASTYSRAVGPPYDIQVI